LRPLLSAYTQVNDKIQATLLIVRDVRAGDNRQIFEEFKQLHPDMQTMVTGYVSPDDLAAYYSFRDVFVQPSLRDGLANALLEAMACEKVVIGPCARGIPDAVSDCENGRLVSTNDAD
jgi:glycosyltransferase involved in cell wall biosynthesis